MTTTKGVPRSENGGLERIPFTQPKYLDKSPLSTSLERRGQSHYIPKA